MNYSETSSDGFKPTPQDQQAEWSLIILAIEDNSILVLFSERLSRNLFYDPQLGHIWEALDACYKDIKVADERRAANYLPSTDRVRSLGIERYLWQVGNLYEEPPRGTEEAWANRIEAASFRRQMIKTAKQLEAAAYDTETKADETDLLASSAGLLDSLAARASCGDLAAYARADMVFDRTLASIEAQLADPGRGPVATSIPLLNAITNGGFRRQEHSVIGSRPGMGKTSFGLWNIAWPAAAAGIPVVFFSVEMADEPLMVRFISALTNITGSKIASGMLGMDEVLAVREARALIERRNFYIIDDALDTKSIRAACKRLKAKHGLGLVVIDYIQLLANNGKSDNYVADTTRVVADITRIAKECDCPVVSLSQFSRRVEDRQDKRPIMSDFAWSDKIGQDASVLLGLYREHYYNPEAREDRGEIIVIKNRHGQANVTLEVGWNGKQTHYFPLSTNGITAGRD